MPSLDIILANAREEPNTKINTVQKFYDGVRSYIEMCNLQTREIETKKGVQFIEKPFTISGLCIHLGITRQKFTALCRKEEYKEICELVRLIAENYLEENMLNGKINPIATIFTLKNNFGWKEQQANEEQKDIVVNIVSGGQVIKEAEVVIDDEETIKELENAGLNFDSPDGE
jgi:hypothetical protein